MIRIRHSLKPLEELELEGSNSELSELRAAIHRFCEGGEPSMDIPADSEFDPCPYQYKLAGLRIHKTTEPIHISVASGALSISGKPEFLTLFADNLPYDAQHTSSVPYHVHFDHIGRENMVLEASPSIVLGLRK